jgi:hypothetical protein
MAKRSDLPFGSEFSPSQIELPRVLEFAHAHGGDWKAFEAAVREAYFESHQDTDDYNREKLANNTKLGAIAYGVIDRDASLTEFGRRLYDIRSDEELLYGELAKHILLNLHGTTLVQCVQDMHAGGETVDLVKLREWMAERGIHFPRGGKHPSMMRLWLEKAGVFAAKSWRVDQDRLHTLLGVTYEEIEVLARLSAEQRAYLKTLANMGWPGPYASNDIEKLANATYGIKFNEKNLPKSVLYPLQEKGFVTLVRATKGSGAKPFQVAPTEKMRAEVIVPLLVQIEEQVNSDLRPFLQRPFADILAELPSKDRHVAGLALEALVIKLMRILDLTYVGTRLRGVATGGAEVDVIFETARLVFSRWQVQCKNTSQVSLDDVAKEVGLTHMLKSNVIVMVSTGGIGPAAREYANKVMGDSNLCIVMMDQADIYAIEKNPAVIVDVFNREAKHAMKLKTLKL